MQLIPLGRPGELVSGELSSTYKPCEGDLLFEGGYCVFGCWLAGRAVKSKNISGNGVSLVY